MRVLKIASLCVLVATMVAVAAGATLIVRASGPGTENVMHGITIADHGVHIRITGAKLDCVDTSGDAVSARCETTVLGEPMVINAVRHPMNHFTFTECTVDYRGVSTYCYAKVATVSVKPDAVVTGLGLSMDELQTTRQENLLTSRTESNWRYLMRWAGLATAIPAGAFGMVWMGGRLPVRSLASVASGAGAYVATYSIAWVLLMGGGFID